jgi:hypothetical protein
MTNQTATKKWSHSQGQFITGIYTFEPILHSELELIVKREVAVVDFQHQ